MVAGRTISTHGVCHFLCAILQAYFKIQILNKRTDFLLAFDCLYGNILGHMKESSCYILTVN